MDVFPACFRYIIFGRKNRTLFPVYAFLKFNLWGYRFSGEEGSSSGQYADGGIGIDFGMTGKNFRPKKFLSFLSLQTGIYGAHFNDASEVPKSTIITYYLQASLMLNMWHDFAQGKKYRSSRKRKEPDWNEQ